MQTGKSIADTFDRLRDLSKSICTCADRSNRQLIAPLFHADNCLYRPRAEEALNNIAQEVEL